MLLRALRFFIWKGNLLKKFATSLLNSAVFWSQMMTNTTGAIPALRGYRAQFLYNLYRLIQCKENEVIYPEKHEDYTVFVSARMTEVTQVKTGKLTLSSLSPQKDDSYFRRLTRILDQGESPRFELVTFGELGEDFKAFRTQGDRTSLTQKLTQDYGYKEATTTAILDHLDIRQVHEKDVEQSINDFLSETVCAIDPTISKDILLYWLYLAAERQEGLTKQQLIEKVNSIGQFISERNGFLTQLGSTLIPIVDTSQIFDQERLRNEFTAGVSTRYSHILANLDIVRPAKIDELDRRFEKNNLVILHGASGQGKSTLAYRYAHERYPASYIWKVSQISNALELRKAIHALSRPFESPFLIILEVQPRDNNWVRFCADIATINHCRVLVCIREEDLKRAESLDELTSLESFNLEFTENEGKEIYQRLEEQESIHHFLNFDEAWARFGGHGPLLEFVYLLRQGKTLRDRLSNQIDRIKKEAQFLQDSDQVQLLKFIALAGAYDARIDLRRITQSLHLNDAKQTIGYFEAEYLVRTSMNGAILEALHPIRARIMMELLFDAAIEPVEKEGVKCFDFLAENDIGIFLLHYFYNHGWSAELGKKLESALLQKWRTCESILTSLFWIGVKDYIENNKEVINQLKAAEPEGWNLFCMFFFAEGLDLSAFRESFGEERWEQNQEILSKFKDKKEFYKHAENWLNRAKYPNHLSITSDEELSSFGKILFWVSRLDTSQKIDVKKFKDLYSINQETFISADTLADLLLGLYNGDSNSQNLASELLPTFKVKLSIEMNIPILEDDGSTVKAHFIFNILEEHGEQNNYLPQAKSVKIINIVRRALPHHSTYATQGYGHQFRILPNLDGDTTKHIPAKKLPLSWVTECNRVFLNLLEWQDRPEDWRDFTENQFALRDQIFNRFAVLRQILNSCYKSNNFKVLDKFQERNPVVDWSKKTNKLPKSSADQWGFDNDFSELENRNSLQLSPFIKLATPELKDAVKEIGSFHHFAQAFGWQSEEVLVLKQGTQNWTPKHWRDNEALLSDLKVSKDVFRLSQYNLQEAWNHFSNYQIALQKYFSKYSDNQEVFSKESDLKDLLLLWHHFISEKQTVKEPNIERALINKEKAIWQEINNKLHLRFRALEKSGLVEEVEIQTFEAAPEQVFIFIYVKDWLLALAAATQISNDLRQILQPAPYKSFRRLVIEKAVEKYWIVPLWEDISINRKAFTLPMYQLLDPDETEPIKITNNAHLTDEMIQVLEIRSGLELDAELGKPDIFIAHFQMIIHSLYHLTQLKGLFGHNEIGNTLVDIQIQSIILKMHESCQALYPLISQLTQNIHEEIDSERLEYLDPEISENIRTILPVFEGVDAWVQKVQDEGVTRETFSLFEEWDQRLIQLEQAATRVSLGWSSMLARRIVK